MNPIVQIQMKLNVDVNVYDDYFVIDRLIINRSPISIYACVDNVKCFLGEVETTEQLYDLVGPKNLIKTIEDNANDYELDSLIQALEKTKYKYLINQKPYRLEL